MEVPHEAVLLRIFTGADDRYGVEQPLYLAIVMKARKCISLGHGAQRAGGVRAVEPHA